MFLAEFFQESIDLQVVAKAFRIERVGESFRRCRAYEVGLETSLRGPATPNQ